MSRQTETRSSTPPALRPMLPGGGGNQPLRKPPRGVGRPRRSFRCPGCGCKLVPDSAVGPLAFPAAPVAAFAFCWRTLELRGIWLALATIAATPAA